jgi:hypothetical protein
LSKRSAHTQLLPLLNRGINPRRHTHTLPYPFRAISPLSPSQPTRSPLPLSIYPKPPPLHPFCPLYPISSSPSNITVLSCVVSSLLIPNPTRRPAPTPPASPRIIFPAIRLPFPQHLHSLRHQSPPPDRCKRGRPPSHPRHRRRRWRRRRGWRQRPIRRQAQRTRSGTHQIRNLQRRIMRSWRSARGTRRCSRGRGYARRKGIGSCLRDFVP